MILSHLFVPPSPETEKLDLGEAFQPGDGVIGYLRLYLAAVAVVALEITGDDHGRYELQQRYADHDGGESPRSVRNDGGVHDGGQQGRPERWQKIELSPGDAVKVVAQLLVAFADALVSEL